jgi:hypothetical protein
MSEKVLVILPSFSLDFIGLIIHLKTGFLSQHTETKERFWPLKVPRLGVLPEMIKINLGNLCEGLVIRPDGGIRTTRINQI